MVVGLILGVALVGCGSSSRGEPAVTTSSTVPSTTTTRAPTSTASTLPPPVTMPNGQPVFEGYPKLVPVSSLDRRVASWVQLNGPVDQVVALAPGVYTEFNPNIPDLSKYLDEPNMGDCAMRDEYFPGTGGACWTGVE
jgi:hypothetical protein